ncbi:MAG TPA: hypothetical protein VLA46_05030 [Saprospiraceae bacterium]|nr:hypothetical protein [Saprospiraceae bacterium]
MKSYISLTVSLLFVLVTEKCEPNSASGLMCNEAQLNKPFTAKIGEVWCLAQTDWKMKLDAVVEDSRCNVTNVDCVWAGRYVMAVSIDQDGTTVRDTFFAVNNWQDTIYSGPYSIYLHLVKPETRPTTDPIDPASYSFEMLIK